MISFFSNAISVLELISSTDSVLPSSNCLIDSRTCFFTSSNRSLTPLKRSSSLISTIFDNIELKDENGLSIIFG